ncbi:MAG: imidazole glycerol phosphate synthase subunit HisH [Anaerolineae bacterium]|nr:imidazole glycerol phosphate synthase subunit HisH [Anaerolineae bacterium]
MNKVAIVDYGMCNLDSVARAVEECGGQPMVTDEAGDFEIAHRIILPGVGAFPDAMRNIRQRSLDEILAEQVFGKQIPFLGICLGMQLLATKGWEGGETAGLGWIEGEVQRLQPLDNTTRIPHIGWNEVIFNRTSWLFEGVPSGKDFYFVHSYHFGCAKPQNILAYTPYCGQFVSAVGRDWIWGVQFHPEKSQQLGFQVLKNFLAI